MQVSRNGVRAVVIHTLPGGVSFLIASLVPGAIRNVNILESDGAIMDRLTLNCPPCTYQNVIIVQIPPGSRLRDGDTGRLLSCVRGENVAFLPGLRATGMLETHVLETMTAFELYSGLPVDEQRKSMVRSVLYPRDRMSVVWRPVRLRRVPGVGMIPPLVETAAMRRVFDSLAQSKRQREAKRERASGRHLLDQLEKAGGSQRPSRVETETTQCVVCSVKWRDGNCDENTNHGATAASDDSDDDETVVRATLGCGHAQTCVSCISHILRGEDRTRHTCPVCRDPIRIIKVPHCLSCGDGSRVVLLPCMHDPFCNSCTKEAIRSSCIGDDPFTCPLCHAVVQETGAGVVYK